MTITLDTKAAALTALDDDTLAQFRRPSRRCRP